MAKGTGLCKLDYGFYMTIYKCKLHLISMVIYSGFYMEVTFIVGLCIFASLILFSCKVVNSEVISVVGVKTLH